MTICPENPSYCILQSLQIVAILEFRCDLHQDRSGIEIDHFSIDMEIVDPDASGEEIEGIWDRFINTKFKGQ